MTYLVARGAVTLKSPSSAANSWPAAWSLEPDSPDEVVTVFNTTGRQFGRLVGGDKEEHYGFQVRVHGSTEDVVQQKMDEIVRLLDKDTHRALVTIKDYNYIVQCCNKTSPIYYGGKTTGGTRLNFATVNYVAGMRETQDNGWVLGGNGYPVADNGHVSS